jgi:hypothetical protein
MVPANFISYDSLMMRSVLGKDEKTSCFAPLSINIHWMKEFDLPENWLKY